MIDAHVHVWRVGENGCTWPTSDLEPIYRDFDLDDLRSFALADGVNGVLLVQSQDDDRDSDWLLSLSGDPLVVGVVGWADFQAADAADRIGAFACRSALKGLRPMVQDREDDWYDSRAVDAAMEAMADRKLVLDALIRPRHLRSLERLALRHPTVPIVIDHAAKPDLTDLIEWKYRMERVADLPNACCKLSGLLTELPPGAGPEAIRPAFDMLWDLFGSERLIWGSDWPVLTLAGSYQGWLAQALDLVPGSAHGQVFDLNARRVYGLSE